MNESPSLPPLYELVALDTVDNVMEEGKRRARDGAEEGTLIWAREQADGRTRRGRVWESPPGNLYCSLIIRPDYPNTTAAQLGYVTVVSAGIAIASVLAPPTGLRYTWPNEYLFNDLKAGQVLLAASDAKMDPYEWMVIGLMVNVEQHPPNPEPELFNSIHASGAHEVSVVQLLDQVGRWFLSWINRWADEGFEPVRKAWTQRADGIGEPIDVQLQDEHVSGKFAEIDATGNLIVEQSDGGRRMVTISDYFALGV